MEDLQESFQTPLLLNSQSNQKPAYLDTGFLNDYFLFWVDKLIHLGKQKPFQQDMHWELRDKETSKTLVARLAKAFNQFKNHKNPLIRALLMVNKGIFFKVLICALATGILQYALPFLIKYIIAYITNPERDVTTGILLLLGIVLSRVFISIFEARYRMLLTILGINTSNAINGLVYEKALKFSLVRSIEHSLGSLTNHIQVDTEKLYYLGGALGSVITLPIAIGIGVYFMYTVVGLSFLSGIAVIALIGGVNYMTSKFYSKAQVIVMQKKDERMKISTEIMNGIKYIKMSGWEDAFLQKVSGAREEELKWIRKQFLAECYSVSSVWLTPILIFSTAFGTYLFTGHEISAEIAFTLVTTLNIIEWPLIALPQTLTLVLEGKVAIDRLTKFLLAEEVDLEYIERNSQSSSNLAVKVTKGNYFWLTEAEKMLKISKEKKNQQEKDSDEKITNTKNKKTKKIFEQADFIQLENDSYVVSSQNQQLIVRSLELTENFKKVKYRLIIEDINIEIKKGSFIAVLGEVGSGKSSFLLSLVGEMKYNIQDPPLVEINGKVSYLPQQPWILNETVKKNIIFGQEFNEKKYQDAIKYSCLQADLDVLPSKDETEIGEKGVNLSGGQKARVSLARSLYRDSDIYLFDDPLSAVDAHVGNFILKECFMNYLKDKTRILVTHKFECLKYVDYIYIFSKGKIMEKGSYENIKDSPILKEVERKYRLVELKDQKERAEEEQKEDLITKEVEISHNIEEAQLSPINTSSKTGLTKCHPEDDNELKEKLMLEEDREFGVVSWKVWRSYFNYYGGGFYFTLILSIMAIWIVLLVASRFWLSYWSDNPDNPNLSTAMYFVIYNILGLSSTLFCAIRMILFMIQSLRCSKSLHNNMMSKIVRAPVNMFFDRVPIGRLLNRLSKDLTTIDNYISSTFGSFIVLGYFLLSDIFICMIAGTVWVFPLVIIFFFFGYQVQKNYMTLNREVVRLESISKSPIVSFLAESLAGLTSIRAYTEEEKFFQKFHELQDENIKNLILSGGLYNWFTLRVCFCALLIIVPSVGIPLLITSDSFSPGMAGLLITYVSFITDDIIYFIWALSDFESKLISLERCQAFTQIASEASPNTKNLSSIKNYSPNWPTQGAIRFRDYYVKYRPNLSYVIKNLTLSINPGEKIGIVGRTGSGKSTLFLSLLRILEPSQGQIFIDEVDISQLGLDDLRRKITIIPQDPMLFKGTLRDNLDLFGKYTDDQLWLSLERVCLKTKFEQENGLNTEIKEGGDNLSAGEKQLLCIGRAILAQSKIILIDEATSNIDPSTEQTILDTIHHSFRDCTVLTIAHRLKTVINSDRILMMSDGQLLEFDAPQKLIEDETTSFHKLWMEYEHSHKDHI